MLFVAVHRSLLALSEYPMQSLAQAKAAGRPYAAPFTAPY